MTSDRSECRCLAAARWTEQATILIWRQFEGYVGHSRDVVVSDAKIYNFECVHTSSFLFLYVKTYAKSRFVFITRHLYFCPHKSLKTDWFSTASS